MHVSGGVLRGGRIIDAEASVAGNVQCLFSLEVLLVFYVIIFYFCDHDFVSQASPGDGGQLHRMHCE